MEEILCPSVLCPSVLVLKCTVPKCTVPYCIVAICLGISMPLSCTDCDLGSTIVSKYNVGNKSDKNIEASSNEANINDALPSDDNTNGTAPKDEDTSIPVDTCDSSFKAAKVLTVDGRLWLPG